jgi:hypothetical protein
MTQMPPVVVDFDDLLSEDQIIEYLLPLKKANPKLVCTVYAVPNYLGPVHDLKIKYPWIKFGIHGFQHTHFECLSWTDWHGKYLIQRALELGYEKLFKPPNWVFTPYTEQACRDLGVILHHHRNDLPRAKGLKVFPGSKPPEVVSLHTHLTKNPATDHITTHPGFDLEKIAQFDVFKTPLELARAL